MPTLYATSHTASFDTELLAGRRWYKVDADPKEGTTAAEVSFAWHVTPFPTVLVPVSLGLRADYASLSSKDIVYLHDASTYHIVTLGADLVVKAPALFDLTPYARVGVPFYGEYALIGHANSSSDPRPSVNETARVRGPTVAIGFTTPLSTFVPGATSWELQLEYSHGFETYQVSSLTVNGIDQPLDPKVYQLTSNAILLGLSSTWSLY